MGGGGGGGRRRAPSSDMFEYFQNNNCELLQWLCIRAEVG